MKRRDFLKTAGLGLACSAFPPERGKAMATVSRRPNVILILTDDQGHGDVGFDHNPKIRTPNMDRLAHEGVHCTRFHVNPVCSPTRASLMTGRYYYRTGVVDTFMGRSMMFPDEVTIAKMLADAGYRTGIFGKWHLGDNYPMRAMDKGFQESLVISGGGLAQPSDPPFEVHPDGAYFDPWLRHNGEWVRQKGYITDVLTDAALDFISKKSNAPFFVYIPYNAPHTPLQVPEKYFARYKDADLTVPQNYGHPVTDGPEKFQKFAHETTARVYAMVECIDDNVGRLLAKLDQLQLAENTIVIFLTDNGPQQARYNSGLLDLKGNTHEGGVRVPCFIRWPGHLPAGRAVDRIAAHIDVAPTLLDFCGVQQPAGVKFDGVSLVPLLQGEVTGWPDRTIFFQWHRGEAPQLNRACAALSQHYKLVQPLGAFDRKWTAEPVFELYDYADDSLEMTNIAAQKPEIVAQMRRQYEAWFNDVTGARDYSVPPRIYLGMPQQKEVLLTRQDWRVPNAALTRKSIGAWFVDVRRAGDYAITLRFSKTTQPAVARFTLAGVKAEAAVPAGGTAVAFPRIHLPQGPATLESVLETSTKQVKVPVPDNPDAVAGSNRTGMEYVEVKFLE